MDDDVDEDNAIGYGFSKKEHLKKKHSINFYTFLYIICKSTEIFRGFNGMILIEWWDREKIQMMTNWKFKYNFKLKKPNHIFYPGLSGSPRLFLNYLLKASYWEHW